MYLKIKILLLTLLIGLLALIIFWKGCTDYPVERGDVPEFWKITADIGGEDRLSQPDNWGTDFYPSHDDRAYYCIRQYHTQLIKYVLLSELTSELKAVEDELLEKNAVVVTDQDANEEWIGQAAEDWKSKAVSERRVAELVTHLYVSKVSYCAMNDKDRFAYKLDEKFYFEERLRSVEHYWLTMLFEFAWLSIVVFLVLWPWLRNAHFFSYALHFCLALPVLFLPYYMGYAPYTFTSACQEEGIVYPNVLLRVAEIMPLDYLPILDVDIWLLENSPRLFASFDQVRSPVMAISYFKGIGPATACLISFVFFSAMTISNKAIRLLIARFTKTKNQQ